MHVFIAPHLDDAVYSCGALIHQLTQAGAPVTIVTIMTGDPPDPLPESAFVQVLHQRWFEGGANPFVARREEDVVAARLVGAEVLHIGLHDAIYRTPPGGGPVLYPERKAIFSHVHSQDPMRTLVNEPLPLTDRMTHLYLPLAVGHHVDHQIVRDWGIGRLSSLGPDVTVRFYEDYPYSESRRAIRRAMWEFPAAAGATPPSWIHQYVLPVLGMNPTGKLHPDPRVVSEADFEAKCAAFIAYGTQFSSFWPDEATMRDKVRRFMQRAVPGALSEQLWALP